MTTIPQDLVGRRALVCGASAGLGRAIALALARRGASIVALARRESLLRSLQPELREAGAASAEFLVADLDDHDSIRDQVVGLDAQILIHNTGGPAAGMLLDERPSKLAAAFHRHVLSAHLLVTTLLPAMEAASYGRVVNILSTSVREPIDNLGVSNTIRGAMASWSKTLSRELPPGITINNVLPGFHDTDRLTSLKQAIATQRECHPDEVHDAWLATVPERRLGRPSDLAELVGFLCSPAGGYIRGASIPVDGGRTRSI